MYLPWSELGTGSGTHIRGRNNGTRICARRERDRETAKLHVEYDLPSEIRRKQASMKHVGRGIDEGGGAYEVILININRVFPPSVANSSNLRPSRALSRYSFANGNRKYVR